MGFEEGSGYCARCEAHVLTRRPEVRHLLHVSLSIITAGLWLPFWLLSVCLRKPWRCSRCGVLVLPKKQASTVAVLTAVLLPIIFVVLIVALVAMRAFSRGPLPENPPPVSAVAKSETLPTIVGSWQPESLPNENSVGASNEGPKTVAEEPRITLKDPRISIQTAMVRICETAGLKYDWRGSYEKTSPKCRTYISVDLNNTPLSEALNEVVTKNGLRYHIQDGSVSLEL